MAENKFINISVDKVPIVAEYYRKTLYMAYLSADEKMIDDILDRIVKFHEVYAKLEFVAQYIHSLQ